MSRLFGNLRRSPPPAAPTAGAVSTGSGARSPGAQPAQYTMQQQLQMQQQQQMQMQLQQQQQQLQQQQQQHGGGDGDMPAKPKTQRYRGVSFKKEYTQPAKLQGHFGAARKRAPSMIHAPTKHMLPPKRKEDKNKVTVVLDLDETLIYAREGPLYARPYIDRFLHFLGEHCETVVWTAGVRAYAQAVIRNIDTEGVIAHCIYRHERWFTGQPGYCKDLSLVGRNIDECLILENTPDCIRGYENNGILVADYEGGEEEDPTLLGILKVLEQLVASGLTVTEFLPQCKILSRQYVTTDLGDQLYVYCLNTQAALKTEEFRFNRDLAKNQVQV